nr:protein TIME FOR COFFEE-like isoform X2 [Ipomoea batatas]
MLKSALRRSLPLGPLLRNRSHRRSRLLAAELQPQPTPFTAADEQIQPPVAACRCSPSPPVASPLLLTVLAAGLLVQEGVVMQEDKQMVVGSERGEQKLGKIFIKEELCKEHQVQKEQNQCRNAIHKENKIDQPSLFALPVAMVGRPGVFPYPGYELLTQESSFLLIFPFLMLVSKLTFTKYNCILG